MSEYIGSYQILMNECTNLFATQIDYEYLIKCKYIHTKNIQIDLNIYILSKILINNTTVNYQ